MEEIAAIIQNAAEMTPYWTDDPATHQDPYENAAKALLKAGYGKLADEYEYAVQRTSMNNIRLYIVGDYWGDKDERTRVYEALSRTHGPVTYSLVKRRKAGKVETID